MGKFARSASQVLSHKWRQLRCVRQTARTKNIAINVRQLRTAGQRHGDFHFSLQHLNQARNASLTAGRQRLSPGPAKQNEIGTAGDRPHDIKPGSHPAIHENRKNPADRISDCWQRANSGRHAV